MHDWYAQPRFRPFSLRHEDATPDRPGVMMIHGFTGSPDELRPAANIAFEAGCDVEVVGLPGMGTDIQHFQDVTGAEWRESAITAWESFTSRHRSRALLGYSLGGALAILAAEARAPDHMVLLAPLIRLADPRTMLLPLARHVLPEIAPFKGLDFSRSSTRAFFEQTMPGLDIDDPDVQRAIREEFLTPTRLIDDCRQLGREARGVARRITAPVTIIQGRPDRIVGHRNARWLVDHLGGRVDYHEVPGNHLIPLDTVRSWDDVRPLLERVFARLVLTSHEGA